MAAPDPTRLLAALQRMQEPLERGESVDRSEGLSIFAAEFVELGEAAVAFALPVIQGEDGPLLGDGVVEASDADPSGTMTLWVHDLLQELQGGAAFPRPLEGILTSPRARILEAEPWLPVDNLLTVPVTKGGVVLLLVGLVNRSAGFDDDFVAALGPLVPFLRGLMAHFDVVERVHGFERELERAEARFRVFMDASQTVAYISDSQAKVRWISQAFREKFSIDPAAVVGRYEEDLIPTSLMARVRAIDEEVAETGEIVNILEPAVGSDGEVHWWKGAKFPFEGVGGERCIGGLAVDVTETVRMSETLREREAELDEARELGRLGRWIWVVERDRMGWDSHFGRVCGQSSADDHSLDSLLDLIHPSDVEPTRRALEEALRGEGSGRINLEHRLLVDGEVRELRVAAKVRREGEAGPVITAVVQDITELRRLQRGQRDLEGAAHKFENLAVLAGSMAREFRELFIGILGNAAIALDDLEPDSLASVCVQDIEASAEHAASMAGGLLGYSEYGRTSMEEVDLSSLVAGLAEAIHAVIFDAVSVRLSLHPALPPVALDVGRVRQLVLDLANNGSEAIGRVGGELTLATGVGDLSELELEGLVAGTSLEPGRYVWLTVRDSGGGIDPSIEERIFEPFFSTKPTSRGLGLAAVAEIVRVHRGGLLIENRPGKGVAFRVLLTPIQSSSETGESWSRTT